MEALKLQYYSCKLFVASKNIVATPSHGLALRFVVSVIFQVHGSVHRYDNLNKNANQMYFVLKSLKFYLHYSAVHVSDTIVSIIRSFSAAHAVSGPYQL